MSKPFSFSFLVTRRLYEEAAAYQDHLHEQIERAAHLGYDRGLVGEPELTEKLYETDPGLVHCLLTWQTHD